MLDPLKYDKHELNIMMLKSAEQWNIFETLAHKVLIYTQIKSQKC